MLLEEKLKEVYLSNFLYISFTVQHFLRFVLC